MLYSLRNAPFMSKLCYAFCGLNVFAIALFFVVMCCESPKHIPSEILLPALCLAAVAGIALGLYLSYRAEFSSLYAIFISPYYVGVLPILMGGSIAAFAFLLAGRPDVRWFAFNTNAFCMLLTIAMGMLLEARALGLLEGRNRWREEIDKYIDYSKSQVQPELTTKPHAVSIKDTFWIAAVGITNIPLLFELYGGGRANAIFLAAPLSIITFSYLNIKTFGPALVRILLLRKIEKEVGYRFQNADYEQIQELRRGFFLSRWLMKDYRPPKVESFSITESDNSNLPVETKRKRKKKNRR
ncbi:MAG: hypothetical protein WAP08_08505 [Smithellaceae bacterium]|nr:hypothetical protein [Smithella sp.]HPL97966.1 hypothetical protein [Smithellaceae bacterium]